MLVRAEIRGLGSPKRGTEPLLYAMYKLSAGRGEKLLVMTQYLRKDHYYKKAKAEGHASRAVYKLEELHRRFRLFGAGDRVLDLGCAPGSWLQYSAKAVGPSGKVVGIDRLSISISLPPQVTFIQADLEASLPMDQVRAIMGDGIDCVISDMAPNTSGVKFQDQCRSLELGRLAWKWAQEVLKPGGNLVIKLLYGDDVAALFTEIKSRFQKSQIVHTQATRKGSTEVYIVAVGWK